MRASAIRALRFQQAQAPQATGYVIPAPVGGLNGRDALANMPETDAIQLDNWFPQPTWVEFRRGKLTLGTFTGNCLTVAAYNALSGSNQLYAGAINAGVGSIYRVDNAGGGSAGAAVVGGAGNTVQAITNVFYDWLQFGTGAAEILYLVNGADNPLIYDGTSWWPITAPVSATITGISQASSAVITVNTVSGANPFTNGSTVGVTGITVGMTQINNVNAKITAIGGSSGAWTITVNINSSAFTAWSAGGILSSPFPYALTNGPSPLTSLSQVVRYKSRLWFVQKGTFNVYYLPQNVFAGALTLLNMAPNFNQGGSLALIATNSVDNAGGINDYIAFVSTLGEVVMYQGYDPAQISTWSEAGHFQIGRPLGVGRRGWIKLGSDAAVITTDGLIPLSKALVSDRSQPLVAITDKIRTLINRDAQVYAAQQGWQTVLYPMGTKIIVHVPGTTQTYQYVQNTIGGAWCTFGKLNSSWNANCFETMGDNLYYGTNGSVAQCDTGQSDDGNSYIVTAQPAFSYMGDRELQKIFTQCQPIFLVSGALTVVINLFLDYNATAPANTVPVSGGTPATWNVSLWNTTLWSDAQMTVKPWIGLAGEGYAASMEMRANVKNLTAQWQSTNYLFKEGSMFYG